MWIYISSYLIDQFILLEVFWEIFSNELGHSVVLTHEEHVHAGHHDDDEDVDDDDDEEDDGTWSEKDVHSPSHRRPQSLPVSVASTEQNCN